MLFMGGFIYTCMIRVLYFLRGYEIARGVCLVVHFGDHPMHSDSTDGPLASTLRINVTLFTKCLF